MQKKLLQLALFALGGRAFLAWQRHAKRQQQVADPAGDQKKHKAPALQRWEGEGGALRTTGAQLSRDPSVSLAADKDQAVPINATH